MNIILFGAGAWGTAIAIHFSRSGHAVTLVPRRVEQTHTLQNTRVNETYLPGFPFPTNLRIEGIETALKEKPDFVFLACPAKGFRQLCETLKEKAPAQFWERVPCISLTKGLELGTFEPPIKIGKSILPQAHWGVFSGPTFANNVAAGKPGGVVLSLQADAFDKMDALQHALNTETLRIYTSFDVVGAEYGGCLKNIYAIGAGICDGLQLGENAKATYLTRALAELVRIGCFLGGKEGTFYGLSGFGDLVATCFGPQSRNRTFGQMLCGSQNSIAGILANQQTVVEGYASVKNFYELLKQTSEGPDAPILEELYAILYQAKPLRQAVTSLMTRTPKGEDRKS